PSQRALIAIPLGMRPQVLACGRQPPIASILMNLCIDNVITRIKIVHVNSDYASPSGVHQAGTRGGRGFSLVELLMVMGILSLLISTSLVALQSLNSAQRSTAAAYDLASYLEMARSEAMARRTYVWVGLTSDTSHGRHDVVVG